MRSVAKSTQTDMFPKKSMSYGGILRTTRKGRSGERTLSTRHTMHVVLRSSKARGDWSFSRPNSAKRIQEILARHARKNFIDILSFANVGNHLHIHLKLRGGGLTAARENYKRFIRAVTGAIALFVMQANKNSAKVFEHKDRFWDYRPFSKIVASFRHFLNMQDYMQINRFEGLGLHRTNARLWIARRKDLQQYGPWPDLTDSL